MAISPRSFAAKNADLTSVPDPAKRALTRKDGVGAFDVLIAEKRVPHCPRACGIPYEEGSDVLRLGESPGQQRDPILDDRRGINIGQCRHLPGSGDPIENPSAPWPETRQRVAVGSFELERATDQATGDCRDVNFDPTILPSGIAVSGDPVLAARASAYAASFKRRLREQAAGESE